MNAQSLYMALPVLLVLGKAALINKETSIPCSFLRIEAHVMRINFFLARVPVNCQPIIFNLFLQ